MRKKVKDKDMILKERMEREMMKSLLEVSPEEEMEDEILRRQQRMVSDQIKNCQENEQIKLQKLRIRFLKVENFNWNISFRIQPEIFNESQEEEWFNRWSSLLYQDGDQRNIN